MEFEDAPTTDVIKRLRRVEGQIGGIIRMLEQRRDCTEIVPQFAAATRALDRAGFRLFSAGMRQCLDAMASGDKPPMAPEELERLFLSLA